jgi:hypothetical protein
MLPISFNPSQLILVKLSWICFSSASHSAERSKKSSERNIVSQITFEMSCRDTKTHYVSRIPPPPRKISLTTLGGINSYILMHLCLSRSN